MLNLLFTYYGKERKLQNGSLPCSRLLPLFRGPSLGGHKVAQSYAGHRRPAAVASGIWCWRADSIIRWLIPNSERSWGSERLPRGCVGAVKTAPKCLSFVMSRLMKTVYRQCCNFRFISQLFWYIQKQRLGLSDPTHHRLSVASKANSMISWLYFFCISNRPKGPTPRHKLSII